MFWKVLSRCHMCRDSHYKTWNLVNEDSGCADDPHRPRPSPVDCKPQSQPGQEQNRKGLQCRPQLLLAPATSVSPMESSVFFALALNSTESTLGWCQGHRQSARHVRRIHYHPCSNENNLPDLAEHAVLDWAYLKVVVVTPHQVFILHNNFAK